MAKIARQLAIQIGCHLESGDFGKWNGDVVKKWHKWRKIARGLATFIVWQIFKLDAKSGPLESGDFGKIGETGNDFAKDAVKPVISKSGN